MPDVKITHVNGNEHLSIEAGPPTPDVKMVINPKSGDMWRAADILDEVQAVLKKYGYALVHRPQAIVLAKVDGPIMGPQARVIADVRQITPYMVEYREVDWSPKVKLG